MKRIILIALCLSMLWSVNGAAENLSTIEFNGSATMDASILSIESSNDNFYALAPEYLYVFRKNHPNQIERITLTQSIMQLFCDENGNLFGLDTVEFAIYRITDDKDGISFEKESSMHWDNAVAEEIGNIPYIDIIDIVRQGNYLYCLCNKSNEDIETRVLYRISITDEQVEPISTNMIESICNYKPGQLLCIEKTNQKGIGDTASLKIYDTLNRGFSDVAVLPAASVTDVSYDDSNEKIYALGKNEVYEGAVGQAFLLKGYVPADPSAGTIRATVVPGSYYCISDLLFGTIQVKAIDAIHVPEKKITISGDVAPWTLQAFQQAHPDIPVMLTETIMSTAEEIGQYIQTGQDQIDIFSVPLSNGAFEILRDKGYCSDLSKSAMLSEFMSQTYAWYTEGLYKGGKLVAIPQAIYSSRNIGYDPEIWAQLGLSPEELPDTYEAFMDFLVKWVDTYSDQFPVTCFMNAFASVKEELLMSLLVDHISCYERAGEKLVFDTQQFNRLLSKFDEIMPKLEKLEMQEAAKKTLLKDEEDTSHRFLFYFQTSALPFSYDSHPFEWFPVALSEGVEPIIPCELYVYIVNPNSKDMEEALTYLEFEIQSMEVTMRTTLCPDAATPIINENALEAIELYKQDIEKMRAAIPDASPEQRKIYEQNIFELEESIKYDENFRWCISQPQIDEYRLLLPYTYLEGKDSYYKYFTLEICTLTDRYLDGQINRHQYINELNRKAIMVQKETE